MLPPNNTTVMFDDVLVRGHASMPASFSRGHFRGFLALATLLSVPSTSA